MDDRHLTAIAALARTRADAEAAAAAATVEVARARARARCASAELADELVVAHAEGASLRTLAAAASLTRQRVHQVVRARQSA